MKVRNQPKLRRVELLWTLAYSATMSASVIFFVVFVGDFTWHPVFDRIFMSIEKSYLHSWHFQWLSRPISNSFTVLATIISSGKLFQISTTLPVNEYFLTFSLHDCFFSFLFWPLACVSLCV